ncbi:TetR/AcrR family transcriptional regulator [Streptacidiphilus sp. EB129]|uniref:TetR/AcrR family transcriptional regulator n=1 Tax=Streptacidiphilus sp. EB129 TaxID=3156262 RepID=UPI003515D115
MAKTVVRDEARQRRRRTKQGAVLTHAQIVETALRMLREHGAQGFTARRLGLALGADASTVYRYFAGMDELTLAIAGELMRRAMEHWRPVGAWRADLRALGLSIHSAYLAHPQAAVLTASRVSGRPEEIAADEAVLGLLREAGFPDAAAVRIYHVFIDQTLAFAALDAASLALPEAARQSDEEMWQATYATLPQQTHPHISATAGLLMARMNSSAYPAALDLLLSAAAAELSTVAEGAAPKPRDGC